MAAKHLVKCTICGITFDANVEPYTKVNSTRYAHTACYEKAESEKTEEQKDLEALEKYIKSLFKENYINARVRKQIKTYREEYNYTYSGILKTLVYVFEIKKNSIDKANGGIGIVPYEYKNANTYYYALWLANQKNNNKNIQDYIPEERIVKIVAPKRKRRKRNIFTFLDEEVE